MIRPISSVCHILARQVRGHALAKLPIHIEVHLHRLVDNRLIARPAGDMVAIGNVERADIAWRCGGVTRTKDAK